MSGRVPQLPWLIYALGGGLGHLSRSLALARVAAAERPVIIISDSPYTGAIEQFQTEENISLQLISSELTQTEKIAQVQNLLTVVPYVLIVDALPLGRWGELAHFLPHLPNVTKVLVLRNLKPDYLQAHDVETFISTHYDLAVIAGEYEHPPLELKIPNYCTEPWLGRSAHELSNRQTTRARLARVLPSVDLSSEPIQPLNNIPFDPISLPPLQRPALTDTQAKLILVLASGKQAEQKVYGLITQELVDRFPWLHIYCLSPSYPPGCPWDHWISHFPAIEYLSAADLVIGGCGYNLFYECMALKLPLIAFPWERIHDVQRQRADTANTLGLGEVSITMNIQTTCFKVSQYLADWITQGPTIAAPIDSCLPNFKNGVFNAVQVIETAVVQKYDELVYQSMQNNLDQLATVNPMQTWNFP
ncbi:MAG: hypothetical protein AAGF93_13640 [Cyanobacteria bacterium P01_H01_bin.105]